MPKYTFECSCGLRFDRTLKMGLHPTHICPSCKEDAPRFMDGVGFGFAFSGSSSESASNTGVHDIDYPTADKAVGRSAESRWKTYHDRSKIKDKVRDVSGTRQLSRSEGDGYVEYTSMSRNRTEGRKRLVRLAEKLHARPRQ